MLIEYWFLIFVFCSLVFKHWWSLADMILMTTLQWSSRLSSKIPRLLLIRYGINGDFKELSVGIQPLETVCTMISACHVLFLLELVAFWPSRLDYQFFVLHIVLSIWVAVLENKSKAELRGWFVCVLKVCKYFSFSKYNMINKIQRY